MFAQIVWDVNPEIFSVAGFSIRWYGVMFALGFLVGQYIMQHIFKKEGINLEILDSLVLYMIVATVIGARVGHYVFYEWESMLKDPFDWFKEMIFPPYAGLASHGAFIGIMTGLWLFSRKLRFNYLWVLDRVAITVALAGCFIRFGNLLNSEIVGKITDVSWAFKFMRNTEYLPVVPRHPAQLYESISCLILFAILFAVWNKFKAKTANGLLLGIFLTYIFGLRFVYEFFKENQEGFEKSMTYNMGQLLSIPAVLLGIYFLWYAISKQKTESTIQ